MMEANDPVSARKGLEETARGLVRMARVLRSGKPEDVLAYRAGMFGVWLPLEQSPPATDGKTLVPPPPPNLKQRFDALVSSQDWLTLLQESLNASAEFILWLDPARYASTAMGGLGALFMKARSELHLQVALLLKRVPNLPTLGFSDGSGFADGPTQMWIESDVMPVLASGEGGGGGAAPSVLDEPIKEARDLAVKGELGKAIDVVAAAAAAAPTPVERFRGQLAVAQLCLGAGRHAIARSQFEGLAAEIDTHKLETWDPALCSDVYAGLYASIKGVNDAKAPAAPPPGTPIMPGQTPPEVLTPEDRAAERWAFERLCRLDPAAALKLAK
jgi:type VI secretion system protein VasJ